MEVSLAVGLAVTTRLAAFGISRPYKEVTYAHKNAQHFADHSHCALLVQAAQSCQAEPRRQAALTGLGPNSKTTLVVATLVTAVALIGLGVYFGIRHAHMLKGCVADAPDGLELQTQDSQNLHLLGATSNIKPGNRVKVSGSKKKRLRESATGQASS